LGALRIGRNRRLQRQQDASDQQQYAECSGADRDDTPLALLQARIPGLELGGDVVHRCAFAPSVRTCRCASTPEFVGVEDWISAAMPCLPISCVSCESAARLGAVTFMSSDCSR